jgi:uncharacterized protein (DUF1684 family)|nr:MAG: hypothetical protein DIU54_12070 [Acidobacteriota bacterium]
MRPVLLRPLIAAVLCAAAAACTSGPPPPPGTGEDYLDRIAQHRRDKDLFFRTSESSPIPADRRASFQGLSYYPIAPGYRVPANLTAEPSDEPVIIELTNSHGTLERLQRVGTITFRLDGQTHTLTAFASSAQQLDRLFVPFGDATNRTETYGGGRYLELERTATGLYDLDFNLAYNPYCVYDTRWVCPLPPPENRLTVAIRAGERLPDDYEG